MLSTSCSVYLYIVVCRPCDYKKLFNLYYIQLRNVIKHIFGIFKQQYKILLLVQKYSFATQAQLVSTVVALHNFICVYDPNKILLSKNGSDLDVDELEDI